MLNRFFATFVLLSALCTGLQASSADWSWRFNTSDFGTRSGASDGFDPADGEFAATQYARDFVAVYHDTSGQWSGTPGMYSTDIRQPLASVPGCSQTWTFYLWGDTSYPFGQMGLTWGWARETTPAFNAILYTLTYVRSAQGVTGGNIPVGTSVVLNQQQQGTWSFPVYKTEDGLTGYMFTLTATVVPEPSALVALLTGLGGFGFALRRRV